jgi:hypothetical protein
MDEKQQADLWKRRFFEAQASAEEFIVEHYGQNGIDKWIDGNSAIAARLLHSEEPEPGRRVQHFGRRLFNQLKLYQSDLTVRDSDSGFELVNTTCGILKYREAARARGVKLTFETPCHYCVTLNSKIYTKYTGSDSVSCELKHGGCVWRVRGD